MPRWLKWILGILLVLNILAVLAWGILFVLWFADQCLLAYRTSQPSMPEQSGIQMEYIEGGSLYFTWPEGSNADGYLLEILEPAETSHTGQERLLYADRLQETEYYLPFVPWEKELIIRIRTYNDYRFPFQGWTRTRYSDTAIELTGSFEMPQIENLSWTADPNADTVLVEFGMDEFTSARIYYENSDGTLTYIGTLDKGELLLNFGPEEAFDVPAFEEQHTFVFDAYSQTQGYTYYGLITHRFTVVREDLLGTELFLECVDEGYNAFTLNWNETKGEYYEVQQYDPDTDGWITVHQVPRDGERTYYTGHLARYSEFRYRVVALGGQTLPDSEYAATPAEVQVETGASLIYSTIWPIQNLEIYSDPEKTEVLGTAKGGTAYCILDMEQDMFYVRTASGYGYIDSRYCMINLPELIGDLCYYDITNSYASLYKAHEFEIPEVTDTVIKGYEDVELSEGEYLVPLLYPVALRLEKAAFAAREEGYVLKIYDSFRPREATTSLYDLASGLYDVPIPDYTYVSPIDKETGKPVKPKKDPVTGEDLPLGIPWHEFLEVELPEPEPTEPTDPDAPTDPTEPTEPVDDGRPTYGELMTDSGRYSLNYFLAKGTSRHNQGIALDLTIVKLDTGKEMEMQTAMHDLSWYSENKANNKAAKTLAKIMTGQGFTGLVSEWWHFQDNDVRYDLQPEHLKTGVSPECWMADDHGWRYRRSSGKFYANCTKVIGGVAYTFDEQGYVIEPEAEEEEQTQTGE